MKTAQGSISVDVSKFVGPLDEAKARLSSFGSALQSVAGGAKIAFDVLDKMAGISSKISMVVQAGRDLNDVFNAFPSIVEKASSVLSKLKDGAISAGYAIKNLPPAVKILGGAGIVAGAGIYATYKSLSAIASIGKSVINTLITITSKLYNIGKAGVSGVGSILSGVFGSLGSIAKGVAIGIGSIGAAIGISDQFFKIGIKSAIELGDEYNTLSKRTGASVGFLYDLGKVLKNNGSSSSYAAIAIGHMQRALTGVNELGQPTADIFKRLKLSTEELQNDAPEKAMLKLGKAILNLKSPAEQTRAATELFGKAGSSMLAVFKDDTFAKLSSGISSTGQTLQKNAENFSKIATQLRDSGSAFRGFFIELAGAVAPEILELFKMFQGGDMLAGFGQKLGAQIKFGADVLLGAFKTGMIFDLLKSSFEVSALVLKDLMVRTFQFASSLLGKLLEADVSTSILSGIGSALTGGLSIISGTLVKALATPLAFFSAGIQTAFEKALEFFAQTFPKTAEFLGIGKVKAGTFAENMAERKAGYQQFADETVKAGFENIGSGIQEALAGAVNGAKILKDALKEFPPQSEEVKNAIADLTGKANALAVAGKPAEKALEDVTGQAELGAKGKGITGAMKDVAVSSLQRIGGGGGAFGGDPLLKVSVDQLSEQKQQTALLKQLVKNPSGSVSALMPNGAVAVFSGG